MQYSFGAMSAFKPNGDANLTIGSGVTTLTPAAGSRFATIVVLTQSLRLRHGADPVATTTGLLLTAGDRWDLGPEELVNARLTRETGTDSTIFVQYYT